MRFTQNVPPGFTRDCTDPWRFLMVLANADVWPCCWYPSIGRITGPGSLIELHNNDTIRTLRAQLGSGELTHYCQNCPGRAVVSVEDFQKKHPELFTPTPCDLFRQALSRGDLSVLADIGDGFAQEGMLEEAGAAYQEAITENPRDPRALAGLGVLDLIQGNPARAAERFALVLETDERDATALCGMGLARKADGCAGEAIVWFMNSLDADPVNVTALHELVRAAHELCRLEEAMRYLSAYLQYKPSDPHILFSLAGVLHKAGKPEGALDTLETLRTFYPTYDGAAELEERIIAGGTGGTAAGMSTGAKYLIRGEDSFPVLGGTSEIFIEESKTGSPTMNVRRPDGTVRRLHSLYDPEAEAAGVVDGFPFDGAGMLVVLGLGLGYHRADSGGDTRAPTSWLSKGTGDLRPL